MLNHSLIALQVDMIQCDRCLIWTHSACEGFDGQLYSQLGSAVDRKYCMLRHVSFTTVCKLEIEVAVISGSRHLCAIKISIDCQRCTKEGHGTDAALSHDSAFQQDSYQEVQALEASDDDLKISPPDSAIVISPMSSGWSDSHL